MTGALKLMLGSGFIALSIAIFAIPSSAERINCGADVAKLRKAEAELPRLDVAPPADKQIVCITLETNVLFASRLAGHLKACPRSEYAKEGAAWRKRGADYAALFKERGCKPTIRTYRG